MDVRNVQQTGNMFYLYLPTSWCRKYGINRNSKVSVSVNSDGTLSVFPEIKAKKGEEIKLALDEQDQDIINKIIVACYIAPVSSFRIMLKQGIDSARLLDQKKLLNVELVEFDGKNITCESTISISDPQSLLRTMLTKLKNLVSIMLSHYEPELLERYEEEIDRSKLLIEKATMSLLSFSEQSNLKATDVHFISILAKSFERITDHLHTLAENEKSFLEKLLEIVNLIRKVLDAHFFKSSPGNASSLPRAAGGREKNLSGITAVEDIVPIIRKLRSLSASSGDAWRTDRSSSGNPSTGREVPSVPSAERNLPVEDYNKMTILSSLDRVMEVLLDWAVLKMTDRAEEES